MAIMKTFGQHEFIRENLWNTHNNSNAIATYSIYWILSVFDYYYESGDNETVMQYVLNGDIDTKLNVGVTTEGSNSAWGLLPSIIWPQNARPNLAFVGWDERLGCGFENASCVESQRLYSMLVLRTCKKFVAVLNELVERMVGPSPPPILNKLIKKYTSAANIITKNVRAKLGEGWFEYFELHSISEALQVDNLTTEKERQKIYKLFFFNQTSQICSFSSFNQFFILTGFGKIEGKTNEVIETIELCWGGQTKIGGTTYFETFSPVSIIYGCSSTYTHTYTNRHNTST